MSVALKVLGVAWQVVVSPDPLVDGELRFMAEPDEDQHVIWLDPAVREDDRPQVLADAIFHVLARRSPLVPVFDGLNGRESRRRT